MSPEASPWLRGVSQELDMPLGVDELDLEGEINLALTSMFFCCYSFCIGDLGGLRLEILF